MELSNLREVLNNLGMAEGSRNAFLDLFEKFKAGTAQISQWETLQSPDPQNLPAHASLGEPKDFQKDLQCLAVCKLNGGLGSSMGVDGPKSMLAVRGDQTFMDLIVSQLEQLNREQNAQVPLILMNSFHTHEDTLQRVQKYGSRIHIECFLQNKFPRLDKFTHQPLEEKLCGAEAWYPPGHGDIYSCLLSQGILETMLGQGRTILFVSNADNLGAVVDPRILGHMLKHDIPFLMEMTPKSAADIKGGALYQSAGRLHLLEFAQVPEKHLEEFYGTEKFKVFNTNNIWINLQHLKKRLDQGRMDLTVIVNEKSVKGQAVVQLETAIGAGLEHFPNATGLVVGRERFLPVKNTSDLMLIQSDLFLTDSGRLVKNPARKLPYLPTISWGESFATMAGYQQRFPVIPSLLALESLDIEGDVRFAGEVTLRGKVSIINRKGSRIIPEGAVLEDEVLQ